MKNFSKHTFTLEKERERKEGNVQDCTIIINVETSQIIFDIYIQKNIYIKTHNWKISFDIISFALVTSTIIVFFFFAFSVFLKCYCKPIIFQSCWKKNSIVRGSKMESSLPTYGTNDIPQEYILFVFNYNEICKNIIITYKSINVTIFVDALIIFFLGLRGREREYDRPSNQ